VAAGLDEQFDIRLYEFGVEVERYPADFQRAALSLWRVADRREGSVLRLGLEYRVDEAEYGDPVEIVENDLPDPNIEDRDLKGFFLRTHFVEERFVVAENMASIGKTEDVNLGWDIRAAAGMYAAIFGGAEDAFAAEMRVRKHWRKTPAATLRLAFDFEGRYQDGAWQDSLFGATAMLFEQRFTRQTIFAAAAFDGGVRLAPENLLYIGSSDGLRGYVNDYLAGDRRWLATVEERYITDWTPWGLVQVGFVAFADGGAIRRFDTGDWSKVYADVGGGFRIGNLKSAFGRVVLATIAVPLVKGPGVNDFEVFLGNEIPF
jgi:hypothetical protein